MIELVVWEGLGCGQIVNIRPTHPSREKCGTQKVIIVCDRYSAYKKLARLAENNDCADSEDAPSAPTAALSKSARTKQKKVLRSLLDHWSGLTLFVEHPDVPMDNNRAENTLRTPVNGRKGYYGSGSLWSAQLAAILFALLQTLALWGINPRHWLTRYLDACAENGGSAPQDIDPFLPWSMDETHRAALSRPYPSRAPPASPTELTPLHDSS